MSNYKTLFDAHIEPAGYDYGFTILGDPKAQGRPRTRIVQVKLHIAELIRNIKARIALIGKPNEPEGWADEITQMDNVLYASGKKAFATIYETKEDKAAKEYIRTSVAPFAPDELLTDALRVDVFVYLQRPLSHYGTGRNSGVLKASAPMYHISMPDRDNLDKLALDALTGIVWKDDSIITQGWIEKQYSGSPRVEIYVKILS